MKRFPWHSIFLSFYAVLFLYAENIKFVKTADLWNPMLKILASGILVFIVFLLVFRNRLKAGVVVSVAMLLFFSYGYYHDALYPDRIPLINVRFDHNFYKWSSLIICLIMFWRLWKTKNDLIKTNKLFNFIAFLLIAMPLYKISMFHFIPSEFLASKQETSDELLPLEAKPSVYYFIMDAYGRNDVLNDLYDFDNSDFTNYLKDKGFYVADKSFANYNKTVLSIPSSLNMTYLDSLAEVLGPESEEQRPLLHMIDENESVDLLKRYGYSSVAFDSPILPYLFMDSVDHFFNTPGAYINLFENELINVSIIRAFKRNKEEVKSDVDQFEHHRRKILGAFEHIKEVSKKDEPFYVHGHILSPHQPFVFNENGDAVNPKHYYTCWIPIEEGRNPENYRKEYIAQLQFINKKLKETIDVILDNSVTPPIIIIQGDHGPCAELTNTKTIEGNNFHERMPILNAYYFPKKDYNALYPGISPVNTFRVILNKYFKQDLPLLYDSSYYSTWERNYDFVNVTEDVN